MSRSTSLSQRTTSSPGSHPKSSISVRVCCVCFAVFIFFATYQHFYYGQHHTTSLPRTLSGLFDSSKTFEAGRLARFHLSPLKHSLRSPEILRYEMVLKNEVLWPNGVERRVITVNGLFPGPTIETRSGDTLEIKVYNNLTNEEGTSLHWHGLRMRESNSQDGTPGITQCPIPKGSTYTYRFQIDPEQSGTFWYHSHSAGQRTEGLFGALIIHPAISSLSSQTTQAGHDVHDLVRPKREPDGIAGRARYISEPSESSTSPRGLGTSISVGSVEYDDEVVLMLHDWYHVDAEETLKWFQLPRSEGGEPVPDDVLLNGMQSYNCSKSIRKINCDVSKGQRPHLDLDPARRYRLRLVNTGSLTTINFSIDSHYLIVIEADGTLVSPVLLREIKIAPGERYSVILKPFDMIIQKSQEFILRMRVDHTQFASSNPALDLEPKAILSYRSSPTLSKRIEVEPITHTYPTSPSSKAIGPGGLDSVPLKPVDFDALSLMPLGNEATLPEADESVVLYVATQTLQKYKLIPFGFVNHTSWKPALTRPLLGLDKSHRDAKDWGPDQLVVSVGKDTKTRWVVDLIVNNLEVGDHPFHLHGHHFYPLQVHQAAIGRGSYHKNISPPLSTIAPALRDTFVVPSTGYAIFRVIFDNPGLWAFHCHNTYHLQTGMGMIFEVMADSIKDEESFRARHLCNNTNY